MKRPVLTNEEIVPFFIDVSFDAHRLFEIVQVRLCDANPETVTNSLVSDLNLSNGFKEAVLSLLESQTQDFKNLTSLYPISEYAQKGSAVHILSIEICTNTVVYSDQFEWDIFDTEANVDEFSRLTIKELGLPAEMTNTLSAQIRWQIIRFRCMHAYPDRLSQAILANPIYSPQTTRGLRSVSELIDVSPAVGLIPGREIKSSTSARNRDMRALKRQGRPVPVGALLPAENIGITNVKLVPIVRAIPQPEDSPNIDLSMLPHLYNEPEIITDEILQKVSQKIEQMPYMYNSHQGSADENDDLSGNEM